MTRDVFERTLRRLVGLKFPPAELSTHFEALGDLPLEALELGIRLAARECDEFPSPAMLGLLCARAARGRPEVPAVDRSVPLRHPRTIAVPVRGIEGVSTLQIPITKIWRYHCDDCGDTGWRSRWCGASPSVRYPDLALALCGHTSPEHRSHEWVGPCPCASTNPDVVRKRAALSRHAASREAATEKGGRGWRS